MEKKIFAIVVTYNAMHNKWIDNCLKSLQESTVPMTVIVVDNGSTDGTRDYVPAHYPEIVWFPQEKNLGFGQANNLGIKYAISHDADYVLLLNQDAVLASDALEKMLVVSDDASLISPLHLNGNGTRIDELFRLSLQQAHNLMNDDLLIHHRLQPFYETGEICAACWLMPINLIKKIGGFNPLFFHYGEDNNYYHRMLHHHVKTLLVPDTFMYHDRQVYGNVEVFNHKRLQRDLLLEACNINQSFLKSLWHCQKLLIYRFLKELRQHQYRIGTLTTQILWLIAHANSIRKSRKQEKKIGPNWL